MYTKKKANLQNSMEQSLRKHNKNEIINLLNKHHKEDRSRDVAKINVSVANNENSIVEIAGMVYHTHHLDSSKEEEKLEPTIVKHSFANTTKRKQSDSEVDSPKTKLKKLIGGRNIISNNLWRATHTDSIEVYKSREDSSNQTEPIDLSEKGLPGLCIMLTQLEKQELEKYENVYYINTDNKAIKRKLRKEHMYDYDDANGDYKLIVGEHIDYRYEILGR